MLVVAFTTYRMYSGIALSRFEDHGVREERSIRGESDRCIARTEASRPASAEIRAVNVVHERFVERVTVDAYQRRESLELKGRGTKNSERSVHYGYRCVSCCKADATPSMEAFL